MSELCEFGEIQMQNNIEYLKCTIANGYCAYIRFCSNDKCLKMLPSYVDCIHRKLRTDI